MIKSINASTIRNALSNGYARAGVATTLALGPVLAFAQETGTGVEAYNTAKTSVMAAAAIFAGGLVAIAAVSVGFSVATKYVKKIGGAA